MKNEINYLALAVAVIIGLGVYFLGAPAGLAPSAWNVFAIFAFVIAGIVLKAAPMGTMSFLAIALVAVTAFVSNGDIKSEKNAWDTMVWFSALVMLGGQLNSLGFIGWMTHSVQNQLTGLSWLLVFPLIIVIYFYM